MVVLNHARRDGIYRHLDRNSVPSFYPSTQVVHTLHQPDRSNTYMYVHHSWTDGFSFELNTCIEMNDWNGKFSFSLSLFRFLFVGKLMWGFVLWVNGFHGLSDSNLPERQSKEMDGCTRTIFRRFQVRSFATKCWRVTILPSLGLLPSYPFWHWARESPSTTLCTYRAMNWLWGYLSTQKKVPTHPDSSELWAVRFGSNGLPSESDNIRHLLHWVLNNAKWSMRRSHDSAKYKWIKKAALKKDPLSLSSYMNSTIPSIHPSVYRTVMAYKYSPYSFQFGIELHTFFSLLSL